MLTSKITTRFNLLLLCLLTLGTAWAGPVSENQARNIASNFMAQFNQSSSLRMAHKAVLGQTSNADKVAYYVFNADRGFVIVSGDDRAPAVLGYSDNGRFDLNDASPAMLEWLKGYTAQIEELGRGAVATDASRLTAQRPIRPLVTACWSQKSPFNLLLPYVNGNKAVVGCVATAMAQVMYYWHWPASPTQTIPQYTSSSFHIEMPALEPVDFNWDEMKDTYLTNDTTSVGALAAATLSLYCAQSVEMDYKESSSGATTTKTPMALSRYFGYKPTAHSLSRGNYTTQQWNDAIYSELAAGRPVIYAGSKAASGHAFICDGYDGNGMFHINWGWNSMSNGYFLLNLLNPDLQGTGSASGNYGYVYSQAAIVGIEPGTEGESEFAITSANVYLDSIVDTRSYTSDDFMAYVSGRFYNYTSAVQPVDFGWGLFQDDVMIKRLYGAYNNGLNPGSYLSSKSKLIYFGAGITSGTYYILPIFSERNAGNWRPCIGADLNYIEVTIDGNNCTFKGYGTAAEREYTVNDITIDGTLHAGKDVDIALNMTNNGDSRNELLYMFVNGTHNATAYVSIEKGQTDVITYRYKPSETGTYTLTFSFNEDGSDPIANTSFSVTSMPSADLSGTISVLDITDAGNKIITSRTFSFDLNVTNNASTTYDEDILVKLYKNVYGTSGTTVQVVSQHLVLAPGQSTTMHFDMDNVENGWKYFVYAYYYNGTSMPSLKGSTSYTIIFPEEPEVNLGDVNGNGEVTISDVTALINYLLSGSTASFVFDNADMNADHNISISDVTALINMLLNP